MSGFCDECDRFVSKLYKYKELELCKLCIQEYLGTTDEEVYDLEDYDKEDYDE